MYNPQLTVDRIKKICESQGISIAQLSEACELNKNTIAVSANSKTGLSAKILTELSRYLGCSADYLLGIVEDKDAGRQMFVQQDTIYYKKENLHSDSIKDEFLQVFDELPLADKIEIMHLTMQKAKEQV